MQTDTQQQQHSQTLFRTITFTLNQQIYALDILHIRDIVIGDKIYRLPNSDSSLIGVTNIRGEILPVYSLKVILGIEESLMTQNDPVMIDFKNDEYLMIVKYHSYLFAIIVDYIDKNISVTPENYNEGKYMSKWSQDTIFSGIIIDETDNILLIDAPALIRILTKNNLEQSFD
ncbi:MAG: chemotaxis protein CheW [Brevinema sp.]